MEYLLTHTHTHTYKRDFEIFLSFVRSHQAFRLRTLTLLSALHSSKGFPICSSLMIPTNKKPAKSKEQRATDRQTGKITGIHFEKTLTGLS
jgi:hypothetical protein